MERTISKHPDHHHYWIEDEVLYETYSTIRGLRFRAIKEMPGEPENENYIADERH